MAFNAGYKTRPTRRVYVLRGFNGCEPETFTRTAAITDGVTVRSGDVVSLTDGKWVLGATKGKVPYIALSDGTDTDVNASGLLPALSCAGQFEIETASYDTDGSYAEDTPLKAGTTTKAGLITNATGFDEAGVDIIGVASRGGLTNLNSGAGPKREVNATAGSDGAVNVLTFITRWIPDRA